MRALYLSILYKVRQVFIVKISCVFYNVIVRLDLWRCFTWIMQITEEQYSEWRNAICNASVGNSKSINEFANNYPELYKHISSMLRKRTKLKSTIGAYKSISDYIYWGALTWSEEHYELNEKTKRKQALRFFDKFFKLYTFVEEYGEEHGRYHIHFLGILKDKSITFDMMRASWHSYMQIECLKPYEVTKKIKYITKYAVKQVPRVRMDKRSVALLKDFKKYKHMKNLGFEFFEGEYSKLISDIKEPVNELPF